MGPYFDISQVPLATRSFDIHKQIPIHRILARPQTYRKCRKASASPCKRHPLAEGSSSRRPKPRKRSSPRASAKTRFRTRTSAKVSKHWEKLGETALLEPEVEELDLPSLPPLANSNIFCYFAASDIPIPLLPKPHSRQDGYVEDLNELRMLMEMFGETRTWSIDATDACCPYCVERMGYLDHHRLRMRRLRNTYMKNFFLRANCPHRFVRALSSDAESINQPKHDIPLRRLTHHLGPSTTNRINNIHLSIKILDLNTLCSAIDIIIKTLPNLQTATVSLPPPSYIPLTNIEVHRLWRALRALDRHLPPENAVDIQGLRGYVKLEQKWRDGRKRWWYRTKATRVMKKRTTRSLSKWSDVCEEVGYPLPNRSEDYPDNYFSFL
ncbi:hypothetical protein EG329_001806 [Mollisiaceae sp. DMI_Dod_QoI]|nr:hypothetical protein EG329_001806 [Helotiales sp. DMI_Dod_QoI]